MKFPDYSNHICLNNSYQEFATKFYLSAADSTYPIRTLRMKSNTKPSFDVDRCLSFRPSNSNISKMERVNGTFIGPF